MRSNISLHIFSTKEKGHIYNKEWQIHENLKFP